MIEPSFSKQLEPAPGEPPIEEPEVTIDDPVDGAPVSGLAPTPAVEDEIGFESLSPNYIRFERRTGYVFTVIVLVVALAFSAPVWFLIDTMPWIPALAALGWLLLAGLLVWFSHFWPAIAYRHIHWRLNEEGIEIRRGVVWRHRIAIPVARVQHVDVSQGPIQRMFELGTLAIHTAGTKNASVELDGLHHAMAMRVRDELIKQKEFLDVL